MKVDGALRIRWLGKVAYQDAWALQQRLYEQGFFRQDARHDKRQDKRQDARQDAIKPPVATNDHTRLTGRGNYLLLLEHPHVFTVGSSGATGSRGGAGSSSSTDSRVASGSHGGSGSRENASSRPSFSNLLVDAKAEGIEIHKVNRGGDITYHGPGQLVGYPILSLLVDKKPSRSRADAPAQASDSLSPDQDSSRARPPAQADSLPSSPITPSRPAGGLVATAAYVHSVEQLLIYTLRHLGLEDVGRLGRYPGVWVRPDSANPAKLAAVGVRLSRGRTMHGFALNVNPDMSWFQKIVPCGISEFRVTSLAEEGVRVEMPEVVECVAEEAARMWGQAGWDWQALSPKQNNAKNNAQKNATRVEISLPEISLSGNGAQSATPAPPRRTKASASASLTLASQTPAPQTLASKTPVPQTQALQTPAPLPLNSRKPSWMRVPLQTGSNYLRLKKVMASLDLNTVCEEAGCPNISECWNDGVATFMLGGERCTRSCGFCLVDTRKPEALDDAEPERLAEAVRQMELDYVVLTAVARDDLADGGARHFAESMRLIRQRCEGVEVEVLIPDFKGRPESLDLVFQERPQVLNHNLETVLRLQKEVRPQASYARSLAVLARAKQAELVTKSSLMVGLGETAEEIRLTMADLAAVGTDIVTLGQYLRPSQNHLPIARWWRPEEFEELAADGEALGIGHVEAGPLVRSSYHAASGFKAVKAAELCKEEGSVKADFAEAPVRTPVKAAAT